MQSNPHLKKPKALLFDWDNTIVDTHDIIFAALNKTLINCGKEPIKNYLAGKSREDYFKQLFGENWEEINKLFKNNLATESFEKLIFFPDIIPLLQNLKKDNIFTAVISNKIGPLLRKEVDYFHLTKYFNTIIGAGDASSDKPSPAPVFLALNNRNIIINKENVYFVGDSLTDIECAKNSDITAILYRPPVMLKTLENLIVIHSHQQLMTMLGYNEATNHKE